LEAAGFFLHQILVWDKKGVVLGRSDYYYQHELVVYGWFGQHKFYGKRARSIIKVPKPSQSELHPTMKPIDLITHMVANSTMPGMLVLDAFGGSGSTMIACEQTGRRCYMMEIDPRYCQIIIDRWEAYSGGEAKAL